MSETTTPKAYSNLRKEASFTDWPSGSYKTEARFTVETDKRGERIARTTQHPTLGYWNKPKKTTYSKLARIADGDDGKTYAIALHAFSISIMQWNLQYQEEYISSSDPRFLPLFDAMVAS